MVHLPTGSALLIQFQPGLLSASGGRQTLTLPSCGGVPEPGCVWNSSVGWQAGTRASAAASWPCSRCPPFVDFCGYISTSGSGVRVGVRPRGRHTGSSADGNFEKAGKRWSRSSGGLLRPATSALPAGRSSRRLSFSNPIFFVYRGCHIAPHSQTALGRLPPEGIFCHYAAVCRYLGAPAGQNHFSLLCFIASLS